jgi:Spy/CpxP family protein refolding chaperone
MNGLVKKGVLGIIMCLTMNTGLMAQDRREHYERIEAIKVAFITKKLDLTTEEAQKFWPVYNNYQKELMDLMRKRREDRQKTDIAPNDKINADLAYESRMLDLKKKYKKLYLKAIPAEKVLLVYQAEREFREHLIKQLNHRRRE